MSSFFSEKYKNLTPYTPGEQPKDMKYIKLNTNESPFPPSSLAVKYSEEEAQKLQLYSDPECYSLVNKMAEYYDVDKTNILMTNGSDEILNFAFMAFCDDKHPAAFANITYGFYPVFAQINNIPYVEIPLKDDFTLDINDYIGINKTIFIANPNAPTAIAIPVSDLRKIIESNKNNIVVIDEAYVDFGAESCVPLIKEYNNLLVTQTFSKSRSMAGARLGMGFGCTELINDLNTIKYSTNPYNINRMTMLAGVGALEDDEYMKSNCKKIMETRKWTAEKLKDLGFEMTESSTNFLFAKHKTFDGKELYLKLKEAGILIRHFDKPEICQYNRITIGTDEQMDAFIKAVAKIIAKED